MRKLAILTFVTLDGVMQAPKMKGEDESNGFELGGWADPYWEGVMQQVGKEAMSKPYDLLLGRKTYELFAEYNSSETAENPLNNFTKYVVSNTLTNLTWRNSILISGNVTEEIEKLKSEDGKLLQVHGSWQLIQLLLEKDLIDELRLWIFPIVLGSGKLLFQSDTGLRGFHLIKSEPTGNGVVMNICRRTYG